MYSHIVMANLDLLFRSISYIEAHLDCDLQTESIAKACFTSKSGLEKTFRMSHFSIQDYILRRRMMKAAQMIVQQPQMRLIDIAFQYGYSSHESFTRSFNSVWNCNPSKFKENYVQNGQIPELFPMITGFYQLKGEQYMRRAVDISQMYDFIKERKNCYCVCADINHLIPINEISHKAGDIALCETMKRLMDCSGNDDVVFRIGNDEFVLITCSEDIKYAEAIREKVIGMNGQTFDFEDKKIPLSLYAVITKINVESMKYSELFGALEQVIDREKIKMKK